MTKAQPAAARRSIGAQRNPESQKAILKAARELIAEEGLAGFSIEGVAKRAQAGKPTIYRWWPSRTLLLLDVYAGMKEELPKQEMRTLEGDIAGFLIGLLSFWRGGPGDVFRSVMAEAQSDDEARRALLAFHIERKKATAAFLGRERPGEPQLTPAEADRLTDVACAYAFNKLLMGQLDVPKGDVRAMAKLLAAGARAPAA